MRIELIYDSSCPNRLAARILLADVMRQAGIQSPILEINKDHADAPEHSIPFGSPTILVNGIDVAPDHSRDLRRSYLSAEGRHLGVPPRHTIEIALRQAMGDSHQGMRTEL